ncbi:MAG: GGDEF domain-containing protein [Thermoleophilaceae bacterium]
MPVRQHQPSRNRREPTEPGQPADERRQFFGRREFELSRDLLCTLDFAGVFKDVNPAWQRTLGYRLDEIVGRPSAELVHPDDRDDSIRHRAQLAAGTDDAVEFENRYRSRDGRWIWLEWWARAAPVEGLIYASARDITARKDREAELERAALVDPLTGLANRRGFERALARELAAANRHSLSPALVVLDLDRFKSINDTLGHQAGDDLLVLTAQTLVRTLRASDLPARIGGDEFAVLLPDCARSTAEYVAGKIIGALHRETLPTTHGWLDIAASAGVALLGQDGVETGRELMRAADSAMYEAKRSGTSFALYGSD